MAECLVPYVGQYFTCAICGNCCHNHIIPLSLDDIERLKILGKDDRVEFNLKLERITLERREWDEGCVFLDDNKCSIHEHKPLVCKLYPIAIYFSPINEKDQCEYRLTDNTKVYLYIDTNCKCVDTSKIVGVPDWVMPLVQTICIQMSLTRYFYEGKISNGI